MKKALLGTSALVGAGLLAFSPAPASANDLELSISGNLILGAYAVGGDDYNAKAQSSVTYNGIGVRGAVGDPATSNPTAGAYTVCWNGKDGDDSSIQLGGGTGVDTAKSTACAATGSTHTVQVGSGTLLAADLTPRSGGSVVNTPMRGDRVEPNDLGIANGPSRYVFNTKGTLDNGLGVGSRVRLEATSQTSAASVIDEHYVWVDGGFGLFQVGAKNGASYQMHYTSPWFTNNGVDSPNFVNAQRTSAGTETYPDISGDAYKINYFTPRFSGLQLGASYAPEGDDTNGTRGFSAVYDNRKVDIQDVYSLGANYVSTVGDVDVAFSGGYVTAAARKQNPASASGRLGGFDRVCSGLAGDTILKGSDSRNTAGNGTVVSYKLNPGKCEDPSEWSLGTQLSMSGFTVGGAYNVSENLGGVKDTERTAWSAGVKYAKDAWNVGIGYYQGTLERGGRFTATESTSVYSNGVKVITGGTDDTAAEPRTGDPVATQVNGNVNWDDAETTFLLIGAGYNLGTGVNLGAEVQIIEDTNPLAVVTGGAGNTVRSSGPETLKTNSVGLTLGVAF